MSAVASGYIRFNYTPSGGALTYFDVRMYIEKGLDKPEHYSMFPPIVNKIIDGSTQVQYKAYIRKATIQTGVLTDLQIGYYLLWCLDNNRTIDYNFNGVAEAGIILIPEPEQEIIWFDDFQSSPTLKLNMDEGIARTS